MNNLGETINQMISNNYQERFKAEYYQTKIRFDKLYNMIIKYEAGILGFKPDCPIDLLIEQCDTMNKYLHILSIRAEIENIEL